MKRSLEMPLADGRTDGTEFIGTMYKKKQSFQQFDWFPSYANQITRCKTFLKKIWQKHKLEYHVAIFFG